MQPDLRTLREEVREYLKTHPEPKVRLAERIGISHSWIAKFVTGRISNPTTERLAHLHRWMLRDRAKRLAA